MKKLKNVYSSAMFVPSNNSANPIEYGEKVIKNKYMKENYLEGYPFRNDFDEFHVSKLKKK